jgi:hypothetical protein
VLLAEGALAESLMRPVRIVVPRVLGQNPDGVAFVEIRIRSVHSLRTVRTNRSASQFARGVRGGVLMIVMFSLRNTVSKLVVRVASWSRMRKRNELIRSPRSLTRLRAA